VILLSDFWKALDIRQVTKALDTMRANSAMSIHAGAREVIFLRM
jgi:hypothetical protein